MYYLEKQYQKLDRKYIKLSTAFVKVHLTGLSPLMLQPGRDIKNNLKSIAWLFCIKTGIQEK